MRVGLNRADDIENLWDKVLPHLAKPEPRTFVLWARFEDAILEKAFLKMARKCAPGTTQAADSVADVGRYATGLLINMSKAGAA
jgi:hypothetical protein